MKAKANLTFSIGTNEKIGEINVDFKTNPHLLIGGTCGTGKSVMLNNIMKQLISKNSPKELKIAFIDQKFDFTYFKNSPYLFNELHYDFDYSEEVIESLILNLNKRIKLFNSIEGINNLDSYNEWAEKNGKDKLPIILLVVVEYVDLAYTVSSSVHNINLLTNTGAKTGIYVILSTQKARKPHLPRILTKTIATKVGFTTREVREEKLLIGEAYPDVLQYTGEAFVKSEYLDEIVKISTPLVRSNEVKELLLSQEI